MAVLALAMGSILSCDTADQDVSPVISPDTKPVATFTPNKSTASIEEGDTLIYTITTDKMIERALTFAAVQTGGSANEGDYTVASAVLTPYTKEVQMMIIFTEDNLPEVGEDLQLEIGVFGIAERYLLRPSSENEMLDIDIVNVNDPGAITIAFGWVNKSLDPDDPDDMDLYTFQGIDAWGAAATSDNPEIDRSIWVDDPDGLYHVGFDPYANSSETIDYTFTIGYPDGTIEFLTGVFDLSKIDLYTLDYFEPYDTYAYRLLEIEHTGENFTITHITF